MNEQPAPTEFRYERKFLVDQLDHHQVQAIVKRHPSLFVQAYPPRFVNNIYLDSESMENYEDNVCGATDRRKVRLRWYGDLFGPIEKPVLEFKVKRGIVGTKAQYPSQPFRLDSRFSADAFGQVLQAAPFPDAVKAHLKSLVPVLLNRYYRWYFATVDNRYRVTIDTELTFHSVPRLGHHFIHKQVDYNNIVVELKYLAPQESTADRVSGYFPFRVTKSSKYVQGIERVFL